VEGLGIEEAGASEGVSLELPPKRLRVEEPSPRGQGLLLYFERVPAILRRHPRATLAAIAALLLGSSLLAWPGDLRGFLRQIVPVVAGMTLVPPAIRYCYDKLAAWHGTMPRFLRTSPTRFAGWLALERRLATNYPVASATGLLLVTLVLVSSPALARGLSAREGIDVCLVSALGAYVAGVALYYVAAFGMAIWRLGDFPVIVEAHQLGIRSVGRLMATTWSIAACLWFLYTLSGTTPTGVRIGPVLMLAGPTAALLLGSFVICQIPLHRRMLEYKDAQLERLQALMLELHEKGIDQLSGEELGRMKLLEERAAVVSALPEWPFQWSAFVRVASLSVSFILPKVATFLADNAHVRAALSALWTNAGG
jgi:hypothetical protein